MKKRMLICLLALLLAAGICAAAMLQPQSTGVLYRVTSGENEMYLLGSIHIGSRKMYPFSRSIRDAMKNAELMVFECDTASDEAAAATAAMMCCTDGESLADLISQTVMEKVEKTAQKAGYDPTAIKTMKPWAVTSLLSMETLSAEMGTKDVHQASALGVENQVRKQMGKKPAVYLETVEEQLALMDSFSPELQEYLLSSVCDTILQPQEALDEDLKNWPQWWAEGNAQAFAASYLKGMKEESEPALAQEYHQTLITQRNERMAAKLHSLLESGERCFVTVGLMHLALPEDSILAHLQALGCQVEKIEN